MTEPSQQRFDIERLIPIIAPLMELIDGREALWEKVDAIHFGEVITSARAFEDARALATSPEKADPDHPAIKSMLRIDDIRRKPLDRFVQFIEDKDFDQLAEIDRLLRESIEARKAVFAEEERLRGLNDPELVRFLDLMVKHKRLYGSREVLEERIAFARKFCDQTKEMIVSNSPVKKEGKDDRTP